MKTFKTIGILGKPRHQKDFETHKMLYNWLKSNGFTAFIEENSAKKMQLQNENILPTKKLIKIIDLAIVIGGDGNLLRAARIIHEHNIKIIGINRGTLGFLTEIESNPFFDELFPILNGEYIDAPRNLLSVQVYHEDKLLFSDIAINEVVLHPEKVAHMISYQVKIDREVAFSQRADGLIISTATGSTAYSLSAGGPIVSPNLDAFIISPMFPHSLSARPIIVHANSEISLQCLNSENSTVQISCDSQTTFPLKAENCVVIKKSDYKFNLIHAKSYNFYSRLSKKLGWASL